MWSENKNSHREVVDSSYGIKFEELTSHATGRDLEVLIKVDGNISNIVYYNLDVSKVFTNDNNLNDSIQEGFFYRARNETSYSNCSILAKKTSNQHSYSLTDSTASKCGGITQNGGLALHSGDTLNPEKIDRISGLNQYNNSSFSKVEIFVRKIQLTAPISCQHGLESGLISSATSGLYNIDVLSSGTVRSVWCENFADGFYTLHSNFGNNTRYSNRSMVQSGTIINTLGQITGAGLSSNATSVNHGDWPRNNSYVQFFRDSEAVGYIAFVPPKWAGKIRAQYRNLRAGSGYSSRMRIQSSVGNTAYNAVGGNGTLANPIVNYDFKNGNTVYFEEIGASVFGMEWVFLK